MRAEVVTSYRYRYRALGWRDGRGVPVRRREEEVRVGFAYPWWLAGVVVVAGLAVG